MRQVGLLRLGGLVISATLMHTAPAAASDDALDGRWIGGFANRNTVVVLDARFSGAPGAGRHPRRPAARRERHPAAQRVAAWPVDDLRSAGE